MTTSPNFLETFFPDVYAQEQAETTTSVYCTFDSPTLQLFTSSLYLAGAITSLFASWFTDKYGRKTSILIASVCFLIGVGLTSGAVALGMMIAGRLMLGVGVGFAAQCVPLYLSEMAPCSARGSLNILFQLATTIGILLAQVIAYCASLFPDTSEWQWRLPLLLAVIPASLLFLGGIVVPDTPNSLFSRGKVDDARRVLQRVRGVADVDAEFEDIADAVTQRKKVSSTFAIFQRRYRPQLIHSIFIPLFQQLSGINVVMFYAAPIFKSFGWGSQASLYNTVIIGASTRWWYTLLCDKTQRQTPPGSVNVLATFVAIALVDRLGRRFLFIEGGVQCATALGVLALLIGLAFQGDTTSVSSAYYYTIVSCVHTTHAGGMAIGILVTMCVFITGFAWSWGPLGWLVPSEIQPLETRSTGTSISTFIKYVDF